MKIKLSNVMRVLVSFGLLGGLFWIMRDKFGEILVTVSHCDARFMLVAALLLIGMVVFLSLRLKIVFDGEELNLTFYDALQLTCVGFFFNNFMPTGVGGDIVKAYYAAHFNKQKIKSYASVFMDRLMGLFTILMIAGVALLVDGGKIAIGAVRTLVLVMLVLGALGIVVVTNKTVAKMLGALFTKMKMHKFGEKLNEVYSIVHDYRNRRDVVIKSILLSIGAQSSYYIIVFLLFMALGTPVNIGNVFLIMPIFIFISMLPSLGGLGVREYALVTFFSVFAGKETAFAVSILALSGYFIISIFGGIFYLSWGFKPSKEEEEELEKEVEETLGAE